MFNKKEYMKKYMKEYNKKIKEYRKKYYEQNKEKILERNKEYYYLHKENMKKAQKNWIKSNKAKFIELCCKSRKRRVERLRESGCINAWNVVIKGKAPKYKIIGGENK